jgi:RimJ/RimL family protein N-acetyltransferase
VTSPPGAPAPRVRLEPFGPDDFDRLVSWVPNEAAMFRWAGPIFTWPLSTAQLLAYLEPTRDNPPSRLIWKELDAASGEVAGHVELNAIDRRHRSARLSRVLIGPSHRGRGLSAPMVAEALEVAFGDLGLHRVDLLVFIDNQPARRCYESLGFVREGLLREVRLVEGRFVDTIVMSVLEDEWRTLGGP